MEDETNVELAENHRSNPSLRDRFDYLSKFLNFTADDILTLNHLGELAAPLIPIVVDKIFQRLLDFDVTKRYFLMRHYGYAGPVTVDSAQLTLESDQMLFRRTNLGKYLKRILRQRIWNDAFLEYLSHVGKIHTNMAGSQSINIDYVHINVLFGYIEHILLEAVLSNEQIDPQTKQSTVLTLNKFFWIQNDFFSMHYINQSHSAPIVGPPNCVCN